MMSLLFHFCLPLQRPLFTSLLRWGSHSCSWIGGRWKCSCSCYSDSVELIESACESDFIIYLFCLGKSRLWILLPFQLRLRRQWRQPFACACAVDIFCVLDFTSSKILWRHPFIYFYFLALSGSAEDKKLCDGEDLPVSSTNDQLPDSTKRTSQV